MTRPIPVLLLTMLLLSLGAVGASAQELTAPAEGKARVYFFAFGGDLVGRGTSHLFVDREFVGGLSSSQYYGIDVEPGEHVIWAKYANKKWFLRADVEAGKTYHIQLQSAGSAHRRFNPVPSPVLHNACPNHKRGKRIHAAIQKRLAKNAFSPTDNTPDSIAETQASMASEIATIWAEWEGKWSKEKKWETIAPSDGI